MDAKDAKLNSDRSELKFFLKKIESYSLKGRYNLEAIIIHQRTIDSLLERGFTVKKSGFFGIFYIISWN